MTAEATARVARVIAAVQPLARRGTADRATVETAIVASSRLSPQGVALAIDEHLETDPDPSDVRRLIERAPPIDAAGRAWVLLSAHVCTAALRAIAIAVASSGHVRVRASRRDPVLAAYIVERLAADATFAGLGATISLVPDVEPGRGDHVFAYGSDEVLATAAQGWPGGAARTLFGTGFGLAVIGRDADLPAAAEGLARDVAVFDQRGCLSPRVALVEGGDAARTARFAGLVHDALAAWEVGAPRGEVDEAERAELARYGQLAMAIGDVLRGAAHLVGWSVAPAALFLPPAGRTLHLFGIATADASHLLAPYLRFLTSVGIAGSADGALTGSVLAAARGARRGPLGHMQRPPLDGPADMRGTD